MITIGSNDFLILALFDVLIFALVAFKKHRQLREALHLKKLLKEKGDKTQQELDALRRALFFSR